jgi:hypothetical protein
VLSVLGFYLLGEALARPSTRSSGDEGGCGDHDEVRDAIPGEGLGKATPC